MKAIMVSDGVSTGAAAEQFSSIATGLLIGFARNLQERSYYKCLMCHSKISIQLSV